MVVTQHLYQLYKQTGNAFYNDVLFSFFFILENTNEKQLLKCFNENVFLWRIIKLDIIMSHSDSGTHRCVL